MSTNYKVNLELNINIYPRKLPRSCRRALHPEPGSSSLVSQAVRTMFEVSSRAAPRCLRNALRARSVVVQLCKRGVVQ